MQPELEQVIEAIKDDGAEKIILFGSRVNGHSHADSDYDLAVIKQTDLPYHQRLKNLRLKLHTRLPLDLFVFTPTEFEATRVSNPLVAEISKQGQVVYAK